MEPDNIHSLIVSKGGDIKSTFIENYFKNHAPDVKATAEKNVQDLLDSIEQNMNQTSQQVPGSDELVVENLKSPDFSITLEQAIKTASTVKNKDRRDVLASLVTERLFHQEETTEATIIKNACEKIESLNSNLLTLLAYIQTFRYTKHELKLDEKNYAYKWEDFKQLLFDRFTPFHQLSFSQVDVRYLETIVCVQRDNQWQTFLDAVIMPMTFQGNSATKNEFYHTHLGQQLLNHWDKEELHRIHLLPVGDVIAQHVRSVHNKKATEKK